VVPGTQQHGWPDKDQLDAKTVSKFSRASLGDDFRVIVRPSRHRLLTKVRGLVGLFIQVIETPDRPGSRQHDDPAAVLRGKTHDIERAFNVGRVDLFSVTPTVTHQCGEVKNSGEGRQLVSPGYGIGKRTLNEVDVL
jgi:hypothetical protein